MGFVLESPLLALLPVKLISSHICFWIKARINIVRISNQIMEKQLQILMQLKDPAEWPDLACAVSDSVLTLARYLTSLRFGHNCNNAHLFHRCDTPQNSINNRQLLREVRWMKEQAASAAGKRDFEFYLLPIPRASWANWVGIWCEWLYLKFHYTKWEIMEHFIISTSEVKTSEIFFFISIFGDKLV